MRSVLLAQVHLNKSDREVASVAVLAEILLKSPQKILIFIIKKIICWLTVSKNKIFKFWKNLHLRSS